MGRALSKFLRGASAQGIDVIDTKIKRQWEKDKEARLAEMESSIHKRNRAEKLTDKKSDHAFTVKENDRLFDRQMAKKTASDKPVYKNIKSVNEDGIETNQLVQVNGNGTYTPMKSTDSTSLENMGKISLSEAQKMASNEGSDKASWFSSDETDFGSEGRAAWENQRAMEIMNNNQSQAPAGKPASIGVGYQDAFAKMREYNPVEKASDADINAFLAKKYNLHP